MNHLGYWWAGVNYNNFKFCRDRYPSPHSSTSERLGSRSYKGEATSIEHKPEEKKTIRVIDDTVIFSSVSEDIRRENEQFLLTQASVNVAGIGVFGLGAAAAHRAHQNKQISDISFLFSLAVAAAGTIISLNRVVETVVELRKWSDEAYDNVCNERRRCGNDIEFVTTYNRRGRVVTQYEVEDIWVRSIETFKKDWKEATLVGGSAVNAFMENFYSKHNPFNEDIVRYVFNNIKHITVVQGTRGGRRYEHVEKESALSKSSTFKMLLTNYRNVHEVCDDTVCKISEEANKAIAQVKKHLMEVDVIVEQKYDNCMALQEAVRNTALKPYQERLNSKLNFEKKNDPFFSPQDKQKLKEDFKADPEVIKIESQFDEEKKRCEALAKQSRLEAEMLYKGPSVEEVQMEVKRSISMTKKHFEAAVREIHRSRINEFLSDLPV